ncbi:patatin-like phospholipase family protein [Oxalobacteraceae bacterium]|nr:patatin-like phospholipase family protein [Oxalobacteraceae bacterium]
MSNNKTQYFQSCLGVFQGGGCRAAAFLGAYKVAIERGVTFVEVAGASAGSIMASFIATGASPTELEAVLMQLDFSTLLLPSEKKGGIFRRKIHKLAAIFGENLYNAAQIYLYEGLYSSAGIEKWVEEKLKILLNFREDRPVLFQDLPIPLSVVATDIKTRRVKIWDSRKTPHESVASAVRASCAIPAFFQPSMDRYYDGGVLSNLPAFIFSQSDSYERPIASRALAFTLKADKDEEAETHHPLRKLVNTVVDGGEQLQLSLQKNISLIEIPTGNVRATDFKQINQETIKTLVKNGEVAAEYFFTSEKKHIRESFTQSNAIYDDDALSSELTRCAMDTVDLVICEEDTKFVYSIFPTLLYLRFLGKRISVLLNPLNENPKRNDVYQRTLLRALGCEVQETKDMPRAIYIFDGSDAHSATAYVKITDVEKVKNIAAMYYSSPLDGAVISLLHENLSSKFNGSAESNKIKISSISENLVFDKLRHVSQYRGSNVEMRFDRIPLDKLGSLSAYAREFKLLNINLLYKLFKQAGLEPFGPAMIEFESGSSIITPPVVEKVGDEYILIEGTTRAMFSRLNGIDRLPCVVVENVNHPLPAKVYEFKNLRVTGREMPVDDRYGDFDYNSFRHIEGTMHTIEDLKK